jgi:Na+/melibiose symporter-like transporter
MSFGTLIYYLPFYFQAARGFSPTESGVYILALAIPDTVVALAVGAAVTFFGHYVPFMVASAATVLVGSGLLSQIRVDTQMSYIVGLELIVGLGLGLGIQLPLSAVRNVLDEPDVPAGEALVLFCICLGFTVAFPIAQAIFMNTLGRHLATGFSPDRVAEILRMGASEVNADHMEDNIVPFVAESYAKAITTAFYMSIAAAAMALVAAAAMEWRKLEKEAKAGITEGVLTGRPPSHLERNPDVRQQADPIPLAPVITKSSTWLSSQSS